MTTIGLGKTLFTQEQIQEKITVISKQINEDYAGQDLVVISVLKGSIYFLADLTRRLTMPLNIDFLSIGVSQGELTNTRAISFRKDLDIDISGRHVLLIEDVIGTGLTLGYICKHLHSFHPASLKICTLLDNPESRLLYINIDYRCFTMPNTFVVGYGLDYEEGYRNLPYIAEYHKG